MDAISKIKAEIERRLELIHKGLDYTGELELTGLLSFIESLEQEPTDFKELSTEVRKRMISRISNEKQIVLISESDGKSDIDWDSRSLYDVKRLLENGLQYIEDKLVQLDLEKPVPKIKGWVARDESGTLFLHKRKPKRMRSYWDSEDKFEINDSIMLENTFRFATYHEPEVMPDLKWEDEPIEVELTIRKV